MSTHQRPLSTTSERFVCCIGDVHGHLQLGLCIAARWQRELGISFEAVVLCGDIGSFTKEEQLDNATRRHARSNPCELEFLKVWAAEPQPEWLAPLFEPGASGLGLTCPVVMVHGNHEGFDHLKTLIPSKIPKDPVDINALPFVDTGGRIRYLPSGWRCTTARDVVIAGLGGIEEGQRNAKYHPLAYLNDSLTRHVEKYAQADLLVTHQGPANTQAGGGSVLLDRLIGPRVAKVWCHGHSVRDDSIQNLRGGMTVVPLHDIAFASQRDNPDDPGDNGWALVTFTDSQPIVRRERPSFYRDFRRKRWTELDQGILICPDLARFVGTRFTRAKRTKE